MKLSKMYTNNDALFEPIVFNDGLNIILGEIRLPENVDKDTHCLGKTVLGQLLDFCLLKGKSKNFFLFKHYETFKGFVFFLEIKTNNNEYLTIKRGVENHTRVSIIRHTERNQSYVHLPDSEWSHSAFPSFDRAKDALDSLLNLSFIKPWNYRQSVSYALRSEYDYKDVFRLPKFHYDIDWKPYIAHILGLKAEFVTEQYTLKKEYENLKNDLKEIEKDISLFTDSLDKLEGLILIKEEEIEQIKDQLNNFNFNLEDANINKELVNELDVKLSKLNKQHYYLAHTIRKIESSLELQKINFNTSEAKQIFEEAGLLFEGQVKKTYDELIEFNYDITKERRKYLKSELAEKRSQLEQIEIDIEGINEEREKALIYLQKAKTIEKYKALSMKLTQKEAKVLLLKQQEEKLVEYEKLKTSMTLAKDNLDRNERLLAENVKSNQDKNSTYSSIKLHFNSLIKAMLDKEALISIDINKEGNLEFKEEIISDDGTQTSESDGKTYKKLLCIAFDIAINEVHLSKKFTHFSFHDGFLENLDNRKKIKFLKILREITQTGYQYIGTLIDSDLPNQDTSILTNEEIILTLHDDVNGTLFKMPGW